MRRTSSFRVGVLALSPLLALAVGCTGGQDSTGTSSPPGADAGGGTSDGGSGTGGADAQAVLTPCTTPTGPGTIHDREVTADETWTAAASPHKVTFNVRILATVRVEPCATVLLDEGYSLTLGTSGKPGALVAKGERGVDASGAPLRRPVTFAASDPSKPWGSIFVTLDGRLDLETVVLSDAASPSADQNGGGAVVVYGAGLTAPSVVKSVRAVDVVVERSRGYGLNFLARTGFTDDSRELTVRDGGRADAAYPVRLPISAVKTLPTITLTGNVRNEAQIVAANTGMLDDVVRARGVPYRVAGRIRVAPDADGPAVTLTVEPGVTLRFESEASDSGLQVGSSNARQGLLVAAGTPEAPITFTSSKDTPAPADWKNLYFAYSPTTGNRIEHAVIEYAGGFSGAQGYGCGEPENDASVLLLAGRPDDAFIKSTIFRNGGGDTGLLLGWTSDLAGPDFVATNTFTAMPVCRVSRWANATGERCPGSVAGAPVCL